MSRIKHVTISLRRTVIETAEVAVAVPEHIADDELKALLAGAADALAERWVDADKWTSEHKFPARLDGQLSIVFAESSIPKVAINADGFIHRYVPKYQDPATWFEFEDDGWATDRSVLIRRSSPVRPRAWIHWYHADLIPADTLAYLVDQYRAPQGHQIHMDSEDEKESVFRSDHDPTPVVINTGYLPQDLSGLTFYSRGDLMPVSVYRYGRLEMIIAPIRRSTTAVPAAKI